MKNEKKIQQKKDALNELRSSQKQEEFFEFPHFLPTEEQDSYLGIPNQKTPEAIMITWEEILKNKNCMQNFLR